MLGKILAFAAGLPPAVPPGDHAALADALNGAGVRTTTGRSWTPENLRAFLKTAPKAWVARGRGGVVRGVEPQLCCRRRRHAARVVHRGHRRTRRPRGDLFQIEASHAEIDGSIALPAAIGRCQAAPSPVRRVLAHPCLGSPGLRAGSSWLARRPN